MNTIKTLAIASLVTFSTLAFTACGGSTSTTEAATDSTAVIIEPVIDETATDGSMMEAQDSSMMNKADSTKTGM